MLSESMSIQEYSEKIKNIQSTLLEFLEDDANAEESFHNLCTLLNNFIIPDKIELKLFLHLISKISKNYHHVPDFNDKIIRIIKYLEDSIKKNLSNSEISNLFKNSKRILLFLVELKIIIFDENIIKKIIQPKYLEANYLQYFQPEIQQLMNEEWFPKYEPKSYDYNRSSNSTWGNTNRLSNNKWVKEIEKELPDDFNEMRKLGENESYICKLIRNDSVEEFISHVNRNNIPLDSIIRSSIYETNSFLIKKQIESDKSYNNSSYKLPSSRYGNRNSASNDKDDTLTLIKYAAFFGSIQIFKYLQINGVKFTPQLWYFVIHGKNAEIIHLLEEWHVELNNLYEICFKEATKCHHNEIANYFLNNYLQNNDKNIMNSFIQGLIYYNFSFLQNELINENSLFYMVQYDYYYLVYLLLKDINIDVNKI